MCVLCVQCPDLPSQKDISRISCGAGKKTVNAQRALRVYRRRDVHKARGGRVPIKKFIISNNEDSTRRGWHWVSCVYEIKRKSSGALQVRGRGPLAVGLSGVMDSELQGSGGAPSQGALNGFSSLGDASTAVFTIAVFYTALANQVALYINAGI